MDTPLLPKRLTTYGAAGSRYPDSQLNHENSGVQSAESKGRMRFGKNRGKLFGNDQEPRYFEWKRTISKSRYTVLLNMSHPNIITINGGEWNQLVNAEDLPLECVLRVSDLRDNRTTLSNGLIDPHRMSVEDVIKSEWTMLISDAHQMCKNARSQ